MYDYVIIGAGIVGAFIAKELSQYDVSVLVLDKENDIANQTSMANSAIIHAGYDPEPGTLKARLNVEGNKMYHELVKTYGIPYYPIGSLTVATNEDEYKHLLMLKERAALNQVEVTLLNEKETKEKEPALSDDVVGSLFAPTAAIIYPWTMAYALFDHAISNGVELKLNQTVLSIKKTSDGYDIETQNNQYHTKSIINCAGVFATNIQAMIETPSVHVQPRKGEYYVLQRAAKSYVNHIIFPVPSSKGKGVLAIPVSERELLVGPSSAFVEDKQDHATTPQGLEYVKQEINKTLKDVPFNRIMRSFAGLRATPSNHDFVIEASKQFPGLIHCIGIESPGFASAPAIAKYVGEIALFNQHKKKEVYLDYKPTTRIYPMSMSERLKAVQINEDYGKIICRCETISKKEIEEALVGNIPATSVKGIKKRVRPGSGVCQGGFCEPDIVQLIATMHNIRPQCVPYDDQDAPILVATAKGENHENI